MDYYYSPFSGNSSRTAFALFEAAIEHNARKVDASKGETRDPAYLAVNPMGKVPALVDGAFRLWESNAINWYLAEKYPEAGLLPASLAARASVQRWLFFQTGHVTPACLRVIRSTHPAMRAFWKISADPTELELGRKELARFLPIVDAAVADREWLEGSFSLADIAYAPHLWLLGEGGFDFGSVPHLRAWLDRLVARPAWRTAAKMVFG